MFATKGGSSYRQLRTSESHYESIVLQLAEQVFCDWTAVRWKKRVFTPEGRGVEPDMILLSRDSFDWTVVEIELEHHSISGHIDDQLERLSRARYGYELAPAFVQVGVPEMQAKEYLQRRPSLLCIVNGGGRRVSDCCQAHGFDMAVMEPYLNEFNEPALNILSLPGQYKRSGSTTGIEFVLRRSADTVFGRPALVVPAEFPKLDTFFIRGQGDDMCLPVVSFGGNRIVFMPDDAPVSTAWDGLRLCVIDIDRSVFEVVKD